MLLFLIISFMLFLFICLFIDSLQTVFFGNGDSQIHLVASTFIPTDSSLIIVGYNDTGVTTQRKDIIYYMVTSGKCSTRTPSSERKERSQRKHLGKHFGKHQEKTEKSPRKNREKNLEKTGKIWFRERKT